MPRASIAPMVIRRAEEYLKLAESHPEDHPVTLKAVAAFVPCSLSVFRSNLDLHGIRERITSHANRGKAARVMIKARRYVEEVTRGASDRPLTIRAIAEYCGCSTSLFYTTPEGEAFRVELARAVKEARRPRNGRRGRPTEPPVVRRTADEKEVVFEGLVVRGERMIGEWSSSFEHDFTGLPLGELCIQYLEARVGNLASGSVATFGSQLLVVCRFLEERRQNTLTPELFRGFGLWLLSAEDEAGEPLHSEDHVKSVLGTTTRLYRFGFQRNHDAGWTPKNWDRMRRVKRKLLRGFSARRARRSTERAFSWFTFGNLVEAVNREYEACLERLEQVRCGERKSLYNVDEPDRPFVDPNPFVVFALKLVTRVGLRSEELNVMAAEDLERDPEGSEHALIVHAPNKDGDVVPLDDAILKVLDLCEAWSEEARGLDPSEGLLLYRLRRRSKNGRLAARMTSPVLNNHFLPQFYRKYFDVVVTEDGAERPLLHAEGDPTQPFWCDYRKLRNAYAVRLADRIRDPALVQAIMRHKSFHTTAQYYLQHAKLDHARKVAIALRVEAKQLVIGLKNPTAFGIDPELLERVYASGGETGFGGCQAALTEEGCPVAEHCLVCGNLIVDPRKLANIEAERDRALAQSQELAEGGDPRGSENFLRLAAVAEAQIQRIRQKTEAVA